MVLMKRKMITARIYARDRFTSDYIRFLKTALNLAPVDPHRVADVTVIQTQSLPLMHLLKTQVQDRTISHCLRDKVWSHSIGGLAEVIV